MDGYLWFRSQADIVAISPGKQTKQICFYMYFLNLYIPIDSL